MIVVCSIVLFVTAVLAAFVFHSALLPCLVMAVLAAALAAADIFVFRKKPKLKSAGIAGCIVILCGCLAIPAAPTAYGADDYTKMFEAYAGLMIKDKYEKAAPYREALVEKYGMTDEIRFWEGSAAIVRKDVNAAEQYADEFDDKTRYDYFSLMESVYTLRYPDLTDRREALRDLYEDAVYYHPDWGYALKTYGVLLFYDKEYDRARSYLVAASDHLSEEDGEIVYFLGASFIEQGDMEKGLELMAEAYSYDLSEDFKKAILAYGAKATNGGADDANTEE